MISLLLLACTRQAPLPDVGDCAVYPDGVYEYGQIGIGTCLAGPTELHFVEDADGAPVLLVTNSNPYSLFTNGSLGAIPWSDDILEMGRVTIDSLGAGALEMPDFVGGLALADDLALVASRLSEDARVRQSYDDVHLVDVSNPLTPVYSGRGPNGASSITVESDPVDVVRDPVSGWAYVANRTSHSVSVIDASGETLSIVQPWPEHVLTTERFYDDDYSGSTAALADLEAYATEDLPDDIWTLDWIEGTWWLWLPGAEGLTRNQTTGNGVYAASNLGAELAPDDTVTEVRDPSYAADGLMIFADGDSIFAAESGDWVGDWTISDAALYTAADDEITIGGPALLAGSDAFWLVYDVTDAAGDRTITAATSADGVTYQRLDAPLLSPENSHEMGGVSTPAVVWDAQSERWRMFYTADDGDRMTIGHAVSDDLATWIADDVPIFSEDGADVAAPVLSMDVGSWRMWVSIRDDATGQWEVAEGWGWRATAVAGYHLGPGDAGAESEGGIRIDSIDEDAGLAWTTLVSDGGVSRIGVAEISADGTIEPGGVVLEGATGFDAQGVASPTVVREGSGFRMYYAGDDGSVQRIGLATSTDGLTWTRAGQVLGNGEEWDSVAVVPGSVETLSDGRLRLWYAGTDGETWRIGAAISSDGETFTRDEGTRGYLLGTGTPGDWDDSGVRDPFVIADEDGLHLWYAGTDGAVWRLGHAFRSSDDEAFDGASTTDAETPRPVLTEDGGLFHPDGLRRPLLIPDGDRWTGWYAGLYDDVSRVGALTAATPEHMHKILARPTPGDELTFSTERGDPDALAIPLDTTIPDGEMSGLGLISLAVDSDRGVLYGVSKHLPYIAVIDIRDDSDAAQGFSDLNYLDVEAIIRVDGASTSAGFRQVVPVGDQLYALAHNPESILVLDVSALTDDASADIIEDPVVGWLPAARGLDRDEGLNTQSSVGPAQMVLHPDGRRLVLTNFNANSVSIYDLALGPFGQWVAEISNVGENPYALVLTPDGGAAVIANYVGEVDEDGLALSTLGVLDLDETSPDYLEMRTWIVNR